MNMTNTNLKTTASPTSPTTASPTSPTSPTTLTTTATSSVHFSSRSDEWPTPQWLFDELDTHFKFSLDPCSTHTNAKCERHFTAADDGLSQDWGTHSVFMNPPYGRGIGFWMQKACNAAAAGATVVCLVPARPDTHWWHDYAQQGEVVFIRGRLKFGGARTSAPFPSALVILQPGLPTPTPQPPFPELANLNARKKKANLTPATPAVTP